MAAKEVLYDAEGVARALDISSSRARSFFKTGAIEPDFLIRGRRPVITADTLKRVYERLRAEKGK